MPMATKFYLLAEKPMNTYISEDGDIVTPELALVEYVLDETSVANRFRNAHEHKDRISHILGNGETMAVFKPVDSDGNKAYCLPYIVIPVQIGDNPQLAAMRAGYEVTVQDLACKKIRNGVGVIVDNLRKMKRLKEFLDVETTFPGRIAAYRCMYLDLIDGLKVAHKMLGELIS